jgi:hypothetical protein
MYRLSKSPIFVFTKSEIVRYIAENEGQGIYLVYNLKLQNKTVIFI